MIMDHLFWLQKKIWWTQLNMKKLISFDTTYLKQPYPIWAQFHNNLIWLIQNISGKIMQSWIRQIYPLFEKINVYKWIAGKTEISINSRFTQRLSFRRIQYVRSRNCFWQQPYENKILKMIIIKKKLKSKFQKRVTLFLVQLAIPVVETNLLCWDHLSLMIDCFSEIERVMRFLTLETWMVCQQIINSLSQWMNLFCMQGMNLDYICFITHVDCLDERK